jgi:hypothetical protein
MARRSSSNPGHPLAEESSRFFKLIIFQFIILLKMKLSNFIPFALLVACSDSTNSAPPPYRELNNFISEISMQILIAKRGEENSALLSLPSLGGLQKMGTIERNNTIIHYEQIPGNTYIFRAWLDNDQEFECIEVGLFRKICGQTLVQEGLQVYEIERLATNQSFDSRRLFSCTDSPAG